MAEIYKLQNVPRVADYIKALKALGPQIKDTHLRLFKAHYRAPNRAATAKQLAKWAEIQGGVIQVNSLYGRLGHKLCDELGIKPELRLDSTYRWWSVWSIGWNDSIGFIWKMLPEVAEALEILGWVEPEAFISPNEVTKETFIEGSVDKVLVNSYERNAKARELCIQKYGSDCYICGFNFGSTYTEIAKGYIHVHHLRPLSEIGGKYTVDPIEDLRPVCPNSHAVLHLRVPAYSIKEIKDLLKEGECT
jgi:5-methylcytosine-specific restriction protein A